MDSTKREGSGTILVVEDDPGVLRLVRIVLEGSGYEVLEATDVDRALELAREFEGRLRLLLTDLIMPHFNGRVLADRVVERDPAVSVLFMSGYTADLLEEEDADIDGRPFLLKPFTPAELLAEVHRVLARRGEVA